MDTKVTVVFVERLDGGDIRRSLYYLVHPLDGTHHLVPAPQDKCIINKRQRSKYLESWMGKISKLFLIFEESIAQQNKLQFFHFLYAITDWVIFEP